MMKQGVWIMDLKRRADRRERQFQRQSDLADAVVPPALEYLRSKEWLDYDWSKPSDRAKARFNMGLVHGAVNVCRSIETHEVAELGAMRVLGSAPKELPEGDKHA